MPERPNFVLIHSHDTGRWVEPYGCPVSTPNLQAFAEEGILFRRAYSAAPNCSSSRAALLTGRYPHNNGMNGLAHRGWELNDKSQHLINPLRDAGYKTFQIGEQHITSQPESMGYDATREFPVNTASKTIPAAIDMLPAADDPFFMSIGFFETHREFPPDPSPTAGLYGPGPPDLPDTPATRKDMANLQASATSLDDGIGKFLRALDDRGLTDRTVVIITTDHGLPLPRAKGTLYDRGTGVMLLMRFPGTVPRGTVTDGLVSQLDIYPTIMDLAGLEHPGFLQGSSLIPLIAGVSSSVHDEVFSEMTFHAAYEPQRAVRTDRWKYIRRFDGRDRPVVVNCDDGPTKDAMLAAGWADTRLEEEQLFDVVLDPSETRNLANETDHRGELDEMRSRLDAWMERTDDPIRTGPIEAPPGCTFNDPDQTSPHEPSTRA